MNSSLPKSGQTLERQDEFRYLSFRMKDEFFDLYRNRQPKWGFPAGAGNSLGEHSWITKYARRKADGGRERFWEGLRRVIEGMYSIQKDHAIQYKLPWNEETAHRSAQEAYERAFAGKWSPPGRGLWMMGTPLVNEKNDSSALQNCAFLSTESITDNPTAPFTRLMDMSMLGVGVGFDVRGAGKVTLHAPKGAYPHEIGDSREGWCNSFGALLRAYFTGSKMPVFDYSNIRPAGAPIKTFGGIAAGPAPLIKLHNKVTELLSNREGKVLTSRDIVDLMNLAGKCLPGDVWILTEKGPRQIKDLVGVHTKVIVDGVPHETESAGFFQTGIKPVLKITTSQGWSLRLTGDHQIKRANGSWVKAEELLPGDNIMLQEHGDISWPGAGTEAEGYLLGHLVGDGNIRKVSWGAGTLAQLFVWDQDQGNMPVRKFIEEQIHHLPHRKDWKGWRRNGGPGRWVCASVALTNLAKSYGIIFDNKTITDDIEKSSSDFQIGFLRGFFDADGSVDEVSRCIRIEQSNKERIERTQRMLGRLGIISNVNHCVRKESRPRDTWALNICGVDSQRFMDVIGFRNEVKTARFFDNPWVRGPYHRKPVAVIESVLFDGEEPVFDVTVKDVHEFDANGFHAHNCVVSANVRRSAEIALGSADDEDFLDLKSWELNPERNGMDGWGHLSNNSVIAHSGDDLSRIAKRIEVNGEPGVFWIDTAQKYGRLTDPPNGRDYRTKGVNPCGEQNLEDQELCTLVETYPINCTDMQDYMRTLKFAYLYGKTVTLLMTRWPETNEVMIRNRRIGTSMTGVAQFAEIHGWAELRRWQDSGYTEIRKWDQIYSEWLGVRESIKVTTIKPSGTVALLHGVTPGVHWPRERGFYVRTVRDMVGTPLTKVMEDAGYKVEPSVSDPETTVVIYLPVEGPDIRPEREVSIWEKAALAAQCQRFWSDNSVSVTVGFSEVEAKEIPAVLRAYDGQLKSISFLPMAENVYQQAPYQKVSREEWESMRDNIKPINWDKLYESESLPEASGEMYCNNDTCEIPRA